MKNFLLLISATTLLLNVKVWGVAIEGREPVASKEDVENSNEETDLNNATNVGQDLYVIRKVVYEIGILTNSDNSTVFDNRTHEQIDVSFFDPVNNGTFIDLSNIPIPIETNVSGVEVTGILSSNLGHLVFPENGSFATLNESSLPLFPDKQVKVTRNVSIVEKEKSLNFLSGISDVLGLTNLLSPNKETENDTTTSK